ncbi:MAG: hypothetical protein K0R73_373, partial [Candidatus Midichloriaceae bacterium]|nr:hypothetical protein [Candidatus Midichloriaceae bacterium]
ASPFFMLCFLLVKFINLLNMDDYGLLCLQHFQHLWPPPPAASQFFIEASCLFYIALAIYGTVNNLSGSQFDFYSGTLAGTLSNTGTFTFAYSTSSDTSSIANNASGSFINNSGSSFSITNILNNSGIFTVDIGSTFFNTGTINNLAGGRLISSVIFFLSEVLWQ